MKRLLLILIFGMMFGLDQSECAGDLNDDGIKNILDVVILMDDILVGNDVCEESEPSICDGLTEVELWGVCYNIEQTTQIDFENFGGLGVTIEIPPEIGNLINLGYLRIRNSGLVGSIPPEIGNLTNLYTLDLSKNQLTGEIPPEIKDLSNLSDLNLTDNLLSGAVPREICLNKPENFDLNVYGNKLCPNYPVCVDHNSSFQDTSECEEVYPCDEETEILLWDNCFNIEETTEIRMGGYYLYGEIPTEIGQLTNLIILELPVNELSGQIPSELGNLTNLAHLELWGNQLSGDIPQEVCDLMESNNLGQGDGTSGPIYFWNIYDGNNLNNTCD